MEEYRPSIKWITDDSVTSMSCGKLFYGEQCFYALKDAAQENTEHSFCHTLCCFRLARVHCEANAVTRPPQSSQRL